MEVFRVFPYLPKAKPGEPGHPLYVHPHQGAGRWDNPDLYLALYVASSVTGAIAETFHGIPSPWSRAMLAFGGLPGSVRHLARYRFDEEHHPLVDLDDPRRLLDLGIRPTDVVKRNRPRTQQIANDLYRADKWAGLSWWSIHRPQLTLHAIWDQRGITDVDVVPIPGHVGLREAAELLVRDLSSDLDP